MNPLPKAPGAGIQFVNTIGTSLKQLASETGFNLNDYENVTEMAAVSVQAQPIRIIDGTAAPLVEISIATGGDQCLDGRGNPLRRSCPCRCHGGRRL